MIRIIPIHLPVNSPMVSSIDQSNAVASRCDKFNSRGSATGSGGQKKDSTLTGSDSISRLQRENNCGDLFRGRCPRLFNLTPAA